MQRYSPRKIPPLPREAAPREDEEGAKDEEDEKEQSKEDLPWDVRCLIYKHLDYATVEQLQDSPVFAEVKECLREIVLDPIETDENGRTSTIAILLETLEKFPHLKKLSGPVYQNNDENKKIQEWGVISIDRFLTAKDVKFILDIEELAYVEFNIEVVRQGRKEFNWETSQERKLLLGLLKKPADKCKFRIKLGIAETETQYIWARYDGGIEFYSSNKPIAEVLLGPLLPFEMRWFIDDVDRGGRRGDPEIKLRTLLEIHAPKFAIGLSKGFQNNATAKGLQETRAKLAAKYPDHPVILQQ